MYAIDVEKLVKFLIEKGILVPEKERLIKISEDVTLTESEVRGIAEDFNMPELIKHFL